MIVCKSFLKVASWFRFWGPPGQDFKPMHVAVCADCSIMVRDHANNCMPMFARDGAYLSVLVSIPASTGPIQAPWLQLGKDHVFTRYHETSSYNAIHYLSSRGLKPLIIFVSNPFIHWTTRRNSISADQWTVLMCPTSNERLLTIWWKESSLELW
jgi:hypothetical protein